MTYIFFLNEQKIRIKEKEKTEYSYIAKKILQMKSLIIIIGQSNMQGENIE